MLFELCTLHPPFDAESIPALIMKIANAKYDDLPNKELYSNELWNIIKRLIVVDPKERADINEILSTPILNKMVRSYLSKEEYDEEFSHTVFH